MDLRELRYFVAVAEEGSFSAAAKRLRVTQPPLSQAITKLEHSLGVRLFIRQQRQLPRLTPRGALLLREAKGILSRIEELRTLVSDSEELWSLQIGAIPSVISGLLPRVVPAIRAKHTSVRLVLQETEERDFIDAVRSSSIDVGFTRATRLGPKMALRPVMREPLYAVLWDTHPLADEPQIDIAQLQSEDFVLFPRDDAPAAYDHIIQACIRGGFSPRVRLHAKNDLALLNFIACGLVVSLVPFLSTLVHVDGVRFVRVDEWATTPLALVHRTDSDNPYIETFEAAVIDEIRRLATDAHFEQHLMV